MSWNGSNPNAANWTGASSGAGGEELYIIPNPANTTTNPSIGLVDGNLIPLPTSYHDLSVTTLDATTGNITTINSTNINNSGNINTATINGHSADASAWSTFPAYHDVNANSVSGLPAYDINNFRTGNFVDVNASNNVVVLNKTFTADLEVGNNDPLRLDQGQGDTAIYGYNLLPGDNALYVSGGTTLDGGTIHGFTTGCLPVAGINTTRIDVNQTGIRIKSEVSGTYIQGAGVTGLVLKGGNTVGGYNSPIDIHGETVTVQGGTISQTSTYGTYATVEKMVIKTLDNPIELRSSKTTLMSGALIPALVNNDVTELFVGSIHGAETGDGLECVLPLRINEVRGVEIDNGTTWTTNLLNAETINVTTLNVSGTTITPIIDSTLIILPQTTKQPPNWNSSYLRRWDQYSYVFNSSDAGGDDLNYFATISNEDIRPDTDTPGTWYLALWVSSTIYSIGQPIYWEGNFYISLQDGNTELDPSIYTDYWTPTDRYIYGYVDAGIQFAPIPGDTSITMITKRGSRGSGEMPQDVSINTKSLTNVELTNSIIVQSPMYRQFDMGQNDIVKCPNLLNDESTITISTPFDMNLNTNSGSGILTLSSGSDIAINGANRLIAGDLNGMLTMQTGGGINMYSQNGGNITISTAFEPDDGGAPQNIYMFSRRNIEISNTDGDHISIGSVGDLNLGGVNININGTVDMGTNTITNCPSLSSASSLTLAAASTLSLTAGTGDISITPQSVIFANGKLDMTNHNIANASTITGQTNLTFATGISGFIHSTSAAENNITGGTNVSIAANNGYAQINSALGGTTIAAHNDVTITSSTGNIVLNTPGLISANNILDMNGNDIINCPSIRYPYYGRFYNNATQTLAAVSTNTPVNWTNAENNTGIVITTSNKLTIANAGKYLVNWSAWLVHGSGPLCQSLMFLRLNGSTILPYTSSTSFNNASLNYSQIGMSSIISVAAGDQLQLVWQASEVNTPITASAPVSGTNGFAGIPSATITITSI